MIDDKDMLSDEQQDDLHDSLQYLENIEPDTVDVKGVMYAKSVLGELCFKNNVYDFEILQSEQALLDNYENIGIPPTIDLHYPKNEKAFYDLLIDQLETGDLAIKTAFDAIDNK